MTEPSVYAEDVSKLKDADELKQACIGLKDTNRYLFFMPSRPAVIPDPALLLLSKCRQGLAPPILYKKWCGCERCLSCADLPDSCIILWKSVIS